MVVSPQLLGGTYGWGIAIIASLAGVACAAAAWTARKEGLGARLDLPSGMLLGLLVWTALQALPLPRSVTAFAQPEAVAMADASASSIQSAPPGWVPLSISPGSTRAEIVKGAALVAAFFAASLLVSLGHRRRVAQLVTLSTFTMALVALGHLAAAAERVFGLYAPLETGNSLLAPLLNQNHLAGFLAMGAPLAIGLGLDEKEPGKRLAYLGGATVIGATVLLCVSRGGVAGLVCGLLALGALGLARTRRAGARDVGTTYATIGAAVAAIAGLGLYVGAESLYRDFEQGDASKLELGANGLALALDHPWFGVGRGAFSAAFVRQHGSTVRYTHPENLLAQWTSEWGLVAAIALLLILGAAVVRGIGASSSWTRLGAAASVVAIVVHDLVDFSLEMAGVAVVAAALLAVVITPRRGRRPRPAVGARTWHAGAFAAGAAILSTASVGWAIDQNGVRALQARLVALTSDRDAFRETLHHAVRLHPAEPVFPLLAGAAAVRAEDDERAVRWLNRAMVLAPGWASPHVESARFLAQNGRVVQAFLELREAEERQRGSGVELAATILEQRPAAAEELVRVAGQSDEWLDRVASRMPLDHAATVALDARLMDEEVLGARVRQARRLVDDDPRAALAALEPIRDEPDLTVQLARAQALRAIEAYDRALRVLDRAEALGEHPARVLRLRARVQAAAGDAEGMRATMERVRSRARGRATPLAKAWVAQGQLEQSMGNSGAALSAFHRAHDLDPDSAGLASSAALAERTGDLGRALREYAELCRQSLGGEGPYCEARDRVERRLDESARRLVQPPTTP